MFVRISKGRYSPDLYAEVISRLEASSNSLVPAISAMAGFLSYYVGADESSCTKINVSVWDTHEHAQAMGALPEMASLAKDFIELGVEFERPIVNYSVLWQLPQSGES
jgi:hypothetical protein